MMSRTQLQQLGEGLVLVATGGGVLYLWLTNSLNFFVYPGYIPLIVAAAIFTIILGVVYMFLIDRTPFHCEHDHGHPLMLVVFCVIPVVLMFVITPRSLSSTTAVNRGLESYLGTMDEDELPGFYLDTAERTLLDWVRILQQRPEPEQYVDKEVRIEGLVIRSEEMADNQFLLGQFVVACCAADARPVGLYVESSEPLPAVDTWIQLEGVFVEGEVEGQRRAVIQMKNYTESQQPNTPYEYL